jgi:hypothetical protein
MSHFIELGVQLGVLDLGHFEGNFVLREVSVASMANGPIGPRCGTFASRVELRNLRSTRMVEFSSMRTISSLTLWWIGDSIVHIHRVPMLILHCC